MSSTSDRILERKFRWHRQHIGLSKPKPFFDHEGWFGRPGKMYRSLGSLHKTPVARKMNTIIRYRRRLAKGA